MRRATFILLFIICHIISEANAGCNDSHADELNFYAITAILDRMVRTNDTLLHYIAGIFSNLNNPVKEVLVTYKLLIPRDEDNCTLDNCDHSQHAYSVESSDSCPSGYYCITTDTFIWAQRRVTGHNVILRHIDTCPYVIGKFARQKAITIYFDFKNPPTCNSSVLDERIIEREELPCGWICKSKIGASKNFQGVLHPRSNDVFYSDRINDESHIDKALMKITSKLRQYAIVKQGNLPGFSYELELYLGYATKYHSSRYFVHSFTYAEYGIFLAAYACMHVMLIIVTYDCSLSIYKSIKNIRDATSGDKDKIKLQQQNIFLYSFIFTSFIKFCTLILSSLVEGGGVCLTQMHIFLIGIALINGILNLPLFICLFQNLPPQCNHCQLLQRCGNECENLRCNIGECKQGKEQCNECKERYCDQCQVPQCDQCHKNKCCNCTNDEQCSKCTSKRCIQCWLQRCNQCKNCRCNTNECNEGKEQCDQCKKKHCDDLGQLQRCTSCKNHRCNTNECKEGTHQCDNCKEKQCKECKKQKCDQCHSKCDKFLQIIVCFYIFFILHILLLLSLLTAMSFIYNPSGTTVLLVYFCLSSLVLWVVNAIVMYLIKENWGIVRDHKNKSTDRFAAFMRILFAIVLFSSFNLINLSIMPFIGDYYYDRRASLQTVTSILVPILVAGVGWYLSSNLAMWHSSKNKSTQNTNLIQQVSVILNQVKPVLEKIAKKKSTPPKEENHT